MLNKNTKLRMLLTVSIGFLSFISQGAMAQVQDIPAFEPTAGWMVNVTDFAKVRGLKGVNLPCLMTNEYDNGFLVRLSGGDHRLLAMAIDFRQEAFTQGQKYNALVSIGENFNQQVNATAFNANTLIFNLRGVDGFYNAIKNANGMEVNVENNVMRFSLGNIGAAMNDLEHCAAGQAPAPTPIVPVVASKPAPVAQPSSEDILWDDSVKDDGAMTPLPADTATTPAMPRPAPVTPVVAQAGRVSKAIVTDTPRRETWQADVGENIKDVLVRWAARANYDLQWKSDQAGVVVSDVTVNGTFEDAVAQLLAESDAANGISGHIETETGGVKEIAPKNTVPMRSVSRKIPEMATPSAVPATYTPPTIPKTGIWNAVAGTNIQMVLNQWSNRAGVKIVWQNYMTIPVKTEIHASGTFEDAVQNLLDQYAEDAYRPVAQLNKDPVTGLKTLLVDLEKPESLL